jgi:hydroxyacylglutathione hydrolase
MGHVAYVFDEAEALFSGDMLFAAGCGRLFEGDAQMMYTALCEKLAALPDSMKVYCGHEYTESNLRFAVSAEPDNAAMQAKLERVSAVRATAAADWHDAEPAEMTIPSTIGEERETNPFMRAADGEALAILRKAKDHF